MTGPLPDDAERIAAIAQRLAEARSQRILIAPRLASELEVCVRPIGDQHPLTIVGRLQMRLSERLPDKPNSDGEIGG